MFAAVVMHLQALAVVSVSLLIHHVVGSEILRRVGFPATRVTEAIPFRVAVGAGTLAFMILMSGLVGLLRPVPLVLLHLLAAALAWRSVREIPAGVRTAGRRLRGAWRRQPLLLFVVVLVGGFLLSQALLPPTDWDSLMYHLEVPRRLLEEGGLVVPADNLHVAYVGLVHMLYVPLLAFGGPAAPALFSAAFAVLLCLAVFSFSRRFFPSPSGVLAAVLLWGTTSVLLVAITPRIDVTVALLVFLVHYALLMSVRSEDGGRSWLLTAGLLGGCAVAAKYHALAYLAAIAPLALWITTRRHDSLRSAGVGLMVPLLLASAFALPWLIKNWVLLDAPLYPFFTERIVPPWLAALAGGASVPVGVDPGAFRVLGRARESFDLWQLFVSPGSLTVEAEGAYYFMNPLFLLLPLGLLVISRGVLLSLLLPAVGYIALITLPFSTTNLRYLLPAVPALTVVAAECLRRVSLRLRPRLRRGLVIGAVILALAPSFGTMAMWTVRRAPLPYLVGHVNAQEYLVRTGEGLSPAFLDVIRFVNEELPADSRTLLILEARGYYFEREVLQDNVLTNWPLLVATGAPEDCLSAADISHVLVNTAAARYYANRGADLEVLRWPALQRFATRCLELVHAVRGYSLFRVVPPST